MSLTIPNSFPQGEIDVYMTGPYGCFPYTTLEELVAGGVWSGPIFIPRTDEGHRIHGLSIINGWPFDFSWFDDGAILARGVYFIRTDDIKLKWSNGFNQIFFRNSHAPAHIRRCLQQRI